MKKADNSNFNVSEDVSCVSGDSTSISSIKVQNIETSTPKQEDKFICGNRIIDMEILSAAISVFCCPECSKSGLKLSESFVKKKGLSSLLVISCVNCDYQSDFYTSKLCGQGHQGYDINRRTIYTMRRFNLVSL